MSEALRESLLVKQHFTANVNESEDSEEGSSDTSDTPGFGKEGMEVHPNLKSTMADSSKKKRKYKGCMKYLHRCDEMILKPVLIYKYER